MSALCPGRNDSARRTRGGGCETDQDGGTGKDADIDRGKVDAPRGPHLQRRAEPAPAATTTEKPSTSSTRYNINSQTKDTHKQPTSSYSQTWVNNIDRWYEGLANYNTLFQPERITPRVKTSSIDCDEITANIKTNLNINNNIAEDECVYDLTNSICSFTQSFEHKYETSICSMPVKPKPGIDECHASHDKRYKLKDNSNRVNTKINCDKTKSDISIIREFRKKVNNDLVVPTSPSLNSTNFRSLSKEKPTEAIYKTNYFEECKYKENKLEYITETKGVEDKNDVCTKLSSDALDTELCEIVIDSNNISTDDINTEICKSDTSAKFNKFDEVPISLSTDFTELSHIPHNSTSVNNDIELISITTPHELEECSSLSSKYFADQKNLLNALEANEVLSSNKQLLETDNKKIIEESDRNDTCSSLEEICNSISYEKNEMRPSQTTATEDNDNEAEISKGVVQLNKNVDEKEAGDRFILAELPNNAYIFLTLPKRLLIPLNKDDKPAVQIQELENIKVTPSVPESTALLKSAKKNKEKPTLSSNNTKRNAVYRNALKVLLFENFLKGDKNEKSMSGKSGVSSYNNNNEVDSAIPFSCITTPEVVDSCNTTSSTSQAAVAVDPKPRSVISSSFNGLPLSRPNYGSTGTTAPDEFKKSLDENGNSVQGFSSPLSGSSQHKKPRRKKSSKNETVIDCRQIDGYQGDKDVNELLRFIESNADNGRGHKLGRAKHRDDADEKGKKRPTERAHRKDKEAKVQRATSMEELSRTTIEELTAGAGPPPTPPLRADKKERRDHAAVKAERRSWGDDVRAPFYYADAPAADTAAAIATELTDFQTVTKKRKPRRRADDNDRDAAPRRTRLPSPRARRESAPPSDRSNDSNDDMDSVHSLPADATPVGRDAPAPAAPRPTAAPAPHASYAEIARTRHNIPDLIESCNFYAEGENGGEQRRAPEPPAPVASDADGYPALEPRTTPGVPPAEAGVPRRPRDPKVAAAAAAGRRERKDRGVGGAEAPAPDVLLGAAARRPRCDLVRDAVEGPAGVAVRAGCAALRYLPPQPPPDTHHLHQIIDYVGGGELIPLFTPILHTKYNWS
ncbi:hypothetical protein K1T71_011173 [Dendrolimus kikuchii]|uniref:Uncharacterized protein n=1 Tax=Dendrolimus kikuchii TaxID=765133 RepID=A0ACC1CN39_9NEOP|nr:hypothetical protein K1T71_011173 [Dendrolimus kikuchii]